MKRNLIINILALLVAVLLGAGLTIAMERAAPESMPRPGTAAKQWKPGPLPAFAFTTVEGVTHRAADFSGKTVLVNFWATWCPPCLVEFPMLLDLAALYPDRLVIIALSSDKNRQALLDYLKSLPEEKQKTLRQGNVLIVHDEGNGITMNVFNITMLPETIVVNPRQKMVHKFTGANWGPEDMKRFMKK